MDTFTALRLSIDALAKVGTMVGCYQGCHFRPGELSLLKKSVAVLKEQVRFIESRISVLEEQKKSESENGAYILNPNEDFTWLSKMPVEDPPKPLFLHWSDKLTTKHWWAFSSE